MPARLFRRAGISFRWYHSDMAQLFLNADDLFELTGYIEHSKQAEWLALDLSWIDEIGKQ